MSVFNFYVSASGQVQLGERSSRTPSSVGRGGDQRYSPSLHTNGQTEASGPSQDVLEQLAINLGNIGEAASVAEETIPVTVAGSSTNPQPSQQTAASLVTVDINHAIPSSSVTGPQTTVGPPPMLTAEGTDQGTVEELATISKASRGTASASASDQGFQTEMENITSSASANSITRCDHLENSLLGLLVANSNRMLAFMENASQLSTTNASSASFNSNTTQTSYDVHVAGESSVTKNHRCQECIELKRQISHLEEHHNIQQETTWKISDNLTKMIKELDHRTSERIGILEKSLRDVSADLQRVATEVDKYKMKATHLQGKFRAVQEAMLREHDDSPNENATY